MNAEFTPGPWRVGADLCRVHPDWRDEHGNSSKDCFHRNGYAKNIAVIQKEDGDWRDVQQAVADARLIAAAPNLYEAADEARILIGAGNDSLPEAMRQSRVNEAWHLLNNALKLARGEQ